MLLFLSIAVLLLWLIRLPIVVSADMFVNLFENDGYIKLYVFGVRVLKLTVYIRHLDRVRNNLVVCRRKREREYHINADPRDKQSVLQWFRGFVPYFDIKRIDMDFRVGKRDDALATTFLIGGIRLLMQAVCAFLLSREHISVNQSFTAEYNRDLVKAAVYGIIGVSIADIIYKTCSCNQS
jgi:hypothetical protein